MLQVATPRTHADCYVGLGREKRSRLLTRWPRSCCRSPGLCVYEERGQSSQGGNLRKTQRFPPLADLCGICGKRRGQIGPGGMPLKRIKRGIPSSPTPSRNIRGLTNEIVNKAPGHSGGKAWRESCHQFSAILIGTPLYSIRQVGNPPEISELGDVVRHACPGERRCRQGDSLGAGSSWKRGAEYCLGAKDHCGGQAFSLLSDFRAQVCCSSGRRSSRYQRCRSRFCS